VTEPIYQQTSLIASTIVLEQWEARMLKNQEQQSVIRNVMERLLARREKRLNGRERI